MKKHLLVMFSVCIVVLFFVGHVVVCAQEKVEPLRIGVLLDFTGFIAEYAPKYRVMQDFYLDEIGWKVAGRPIKLCIEDSTSDAAKAIVKARKLVEVDKVHMLVGTLWGSVVQAVSVYAAEVKIPHITWGESQYEALERGWSFAIQTPMEVGGYMAGKLAYDRGYRTAISIAPDYVSGYKCNGGAMQGFIDKGGKVLQKQWPPPVTMEFGPYITKMPRADVCIFWFPGTYQLIFAKQYKEFGLLDKMPLLTPTGDSIIKEVMSKTDLSLAGRVFGRTSYIPDIDTPANKRYVEAVRAKTGMDPDPLDTSAYIGMMLAMSAVEKTKGDTDPEKLRKAMLGATLMTPAGLVRISPERYVYRTMYAFEYVERGGKIVMKRIGEYSEKELEYIRLRPGIAP